MQKNRSIRAAIFVALTLSFSWLAAPARAESGKLYRYTSSFLAAMAPPESARTTWCVI